MDERLRALNRFGLGARVGEAERVTDPRRWLREQLDGASEVPSADGPHSLDDALAALAAVRAAAADGDPAGAAEARGRLREIATDEGAAMLARRLTSASPFVERLVGFWSNHLCVSVAKAQVVPLAGHYERTVVRPHVLGRFEDMVLASARHPAMLFYLDNFRSIGPDSTAGARTARRGRARGLTENYARELLELHTLGVDGGYTQADVAALARLLTGWTVAGDPAGEGTGGRGGPDAARLGRFLRSESVDGAPGFAFRPAFHEPGTKTLLGKSYREDGRAAGEAAIRDLCAHPSTIRFVSAKLVRHFVSDDPPAEAIEHVSAVFRRTGGDLREVSAALVDLDAAWRPDAQKLRTPQDWLTAALRALDVDEAPETAIGVLRQLRHMPWNPPSPRGFPDDLAGWGDPDSLIRRAELARSLAGRLAGGGRRGGTPFEPSDLLTVMDRDPADPLAEMLRDRSISAADRVALALGGPAFQWR